MSLLIAATSTVAVFLFATGAALAADSFVG